MLLGVAGGCFRKAQMSALGMWQGVLAHTGVRAQGPSLPVPGQPLVTPLPHQVTCLLQSPRVGRLPSLPAGGAAVMSARYNSLFVLCVGKTDFGRQVVHNITSLRVPKGVFWELAAPLPAQVPETWGRDGAVWYHCALVPQGC